MARPRTKRRITGDLGPRAFVPRGSRPGAVERLTLTLDGLEALRLTDLEGLYQEEAAQRMGVSRATFARVLTEARGAVADALVNGKAVQISGGPVEHRSESGWPCPIHGGAQRRGRGCHCGRPPVAPAWPPRR